MTTERTQTLLSTLERFVNQRPGLEFGNYGDVSAYRSEMRGITKDRRDALELLRVAGWCLTADDIIAAAQGGRLTITEPEPGRFVIDYCTGQYWPTEYRPAVCRVLASALWHYWAADKPSADQVRECARRHLSRGVASRWFR
jgi:hypothetical protein